MSKAKHKNQIRQCPQCHEKFNAPAKAASQTLCPACAAFDGLVEDSSLQQKTRWNIFGRKKNEGGPKDVQVSVVEPEDASQSHTVYPTCKKCDGRLVTSAKKKRSILVRWFRELIHLSIAAALFPIVPPYGAIVGLAYFLIASWLNNRTTVLTICQQCGQVLKYDSRGDATAISDFR